MLTLPGKTNLNTHQETTSQVKYAWELPKERIILEIILKSILRPAKSQEKEHPSVICNLTMQTSSNGLSGKGREGRKREERKESRKHYLGFRYSILVLI